MTDTEKLILFTTLAIFADGKKVSIKAIATRSGISRQNIYYYINKHRNKSIKELIEK
ncbi:hypothetical protein [Sulfurimonas sp. NWX367]|uniref:hypothetical protein n=1 Tax=unclassified Sulfurimonas TaxID=2623549 RepID=UPI0032049CB0